MSPSERDQNQPADAAADPTRDAPAPTQPLSDADDSVAHIAALVRRTTERQAETRPSHVAQPDATVAHQPPMPAPQVTQPAPQITPPAPQVTPPDAEASRPTMWPPSRRILVTAGIIVVLLIGGVVALTRPSAPDAASRPVAKVAAATPFGYAVKATDVITDCAGHAHGKTKVSFEAKNCVKATRLLATGKVGGRPVLFVVSRIEMPTGEAAASIKQVLDSSGTGNLNDLLREGKTYPGAPLKMPISGYASMQKAKVVTVAEAGFVDDGRSSNTDPALRDAAAQVAALVSTQG